MTTLGCPRVGFDIVREGNSDHIIYNLVKQTKICVIVPGTSNLKFQACSKRWLLRKRAYSKYIEKSTTKNWKFSDKNFVIFHISAQNIHCGYSLEPPRRGGSNKYPQSMFLSRNKKK